MLFSLCSFRTYVVTTRKWFDFIFLMETTFNNEPWNYMYHITNIFNTSLDFIETDFLSFKFVQTCLPHGPETGNNLLKDTHTHTVGDISYLWHVLTGSLASNKLLNLSNTSCTLTSKFVALFDQVNKNRIFYVVVCFKIVCEK